MGTISLCDSNSSFLFLTLYVPGFYANEAIYDIGQKAIAVFFFLL